MPGRCDREPSSVERIARFDRRKRRPLPTSVVSMLASIAVCTMVNSAPGWAQEVGVARSVVNNVTRTKPAERERTVVRVGDNLVQNEVINTAAHSATLVAFQDSSQLAICPSAEVVVNRAEFGAGPTGPALVIFIANGCTQFSSGLLLKTVLFRTPSAEIRTSGTILTVTVSARGGTTVSVAEGAAGVTGAGRTVTVGAGQSTLVLPGQPPTVTVTTPPEPPIVTEMTRLLAAPAQNYGTRAAARSPQVEAPHGANMFSPNIDGKIQSEIANNPALVTNTPAFITSTPPSKTSR